MNLVSLVCGVGGRVPLEGPVRVVARFYVKRPPSHLKADGTLKASSPRWPTPRPDADNFLKLLLDGMEGTAYRDDAQVIDARALKLYGDPRTVVEIESLSEEV